MQLQVVGSQLSVTDCLAVRAVCHAGGPNAKNSSADDPPAERQQAWQGDRLCETKPISAYEGHSPARAAAYYEFRAWPVIY